MCVPNIDIGAAHGTHSRTHAQRPPRASTRCRIICCCWTICGKSPGSLAQKPAATAANAAPAPCWSMISPTLLPDAGRRRRRPAVDTVESLGGDGHLSAVQRGFHEKLGSQCGYCTPGFIMASAGLLRRNPRPSDDDIREALGSNICRCTGYVKIIEAVKYAAELNAAGWRRERDRADPQHRQLRADGRRAREGLGSGEIHRRPDRARHARRADLPQPLCPRRHPRGRRLRGVRSFPA